MSSKDRRITALKRRLHNLALSINILHQQREGPHDPTTCPVCISLAPELQEPK